MRATCSLSARPLPVTADLTSAGLYSQISMPRPASTASRAPRAWASTISECAFMPWKGVSSDGQVRRLAVDQLLEAAGEVGQPPRQVEVARAGEAAGVDGRERRSRCLLDQAVAGVQAARIESPG